MKEGFDNQPPLNNLPREGKRTPITSKSRGTTPRREGLQSIPKATLDPQSSEIRYVDDNSTCATKQNLDLYRRSEESPRNSPPFRSPVHSTSKDLLNPSHEQINSLSSPANGSRHITCITHESPSARCRISSKSPIKSNQPEKSQAQNNLELDECFDLSKQEKVLLQMTVELRPASSPNRADNQGSIQVKKSANKSSLGKGNIADVEQVISNDSPAQGCPRCSYDEFSLGNHNLESNAVSNTETARKSSANRPVEFPKISINKPSVEKSMEERRQEQAEREYQFVSNDEGSNLQNVTSTTIDKRSEGKRGIYHQEQHQNAVEENAEESEGAVDNIKQEAISLAESSSSQAEVEIEEQPAPPNANQPSNKEIQTGLEPRARYTVLEDLQIINYVKAKGGNNILSRRFWERAYELDKLLEQSRSADSMRERFRNHLRYVTEEELEIIQEWISANQGNGYAVFATRPPDSGSKKSLRGIETRPDTSHQLSQQPKKIKPTQSQPNKTVNSEANEQEVMEEEIVLKKRPEPASRKTLPIKNNKPSPREQMESEHSSLTEEEHVECESADRPRALTRRVTEDEDIRRRLIEFRSKPVENQKPGPEILRKAMYVNNASTKRKVYENSHVITEEMIPGKIARLNPCTNNPRATIRPERTKKDDVRGDEHKEMYKIRFNPETIHNKQKWLMEQAQIYGINSTEILDLFYWCSMNCQNLKRYLQGEKDILWDEREDLLLVGPARQLAWHVLARYKGPMVVKEREEFLEKVELLGKFQQRETSKNRR